LIFYSDLRRSTVSDTDMSGNVVGVSVAMVAVASSGMQQIFCRSMQQKHNLASHELLANVAPAQV
jgi:solute carrier family 35 protein E3